MLFPASLRQRTWYCGRVINIVSWVFDGLRRVHENFDINVIKFVTIYDPAKIYITSSKLSGE
jgi:hypothetical protein